MLAGSSAHGITGLHIICGNSRAACVVRFVLGGLKTFITFRVSSRGILLRSTGASRIAGHVYLGGITPGRALNRQFAPARADRISTRVRLRQASATASWITLIAQSSN